MNPHGVSRTAVSARGRPRPHGHTIDRMVRFLVRVAVFLGSAAIGRLVTALATLLLPMLLVRRKAGEATQR